MSDSLSVSEYLSMNKNVSTILIEKSKKISWYELNISADPEIVKIRRKVGEVRSEIHRMRGFVRFNSINDKILFGYMKPEHKIGELIVDIFAKRFQKNMIILGNNHEAWVSYYSEKSYKKYENSKSLKETLEEIKTLIGSNQELDISRIWQVYYDSQYIKERENHKLFYKNMPKKYLKSAGNKIELRLNAKTLDDYISD
jgi:probable DNA metabolism protein